ncbi:MAG TPA: energy transducer TonB [Vicinamibacterales bacterium]|nr:energy transducer TonB [Vicinamibacterales bacterium]
MPRELFGEVVNPQPRLGSQSRYTVPLSIAVHVVIAAVVVMVPLMAADVLPMPRVMIGAFTIQPSLPSPPPPAASSPVRTHAPSAARPDVAPSDPPATLAAEPATTTSVIGDPGGVPGGLPGGSIGGVGSVAAVPVVPLPPMPTRPLPVGGRIKEPAKIRHVAPVYPVIAQQARVDGIVIIEAVIGTDGRVKDARVLRSKPLLDQAALAAVRQWIFTPTMLNGAPVPVIMTVTVHFRLN